MALPKWFDWLLSIWIVFVGFVYYAGSAGVVTPPDTAVVAWVSERTDTLAMVYAIMLVVSVLCAVFAYLRKPTSNATS